MVRRENSTMDFMGGYVRRRANAVFSGPDVFAVAVPEQFVAAKSGKGSHRVSQDSPQHSNMSGA